MNKKNSGNLDKHIATLTWCWCCFLSLTAPSMYDCTFDSPNPCQWSQDLSNDQFDWRIHAGGTSSGFTGPKSDHTLQNTRGKRNTPPIKKNQPISPLLSSYRVPWMIIAELYFALIMLSVHNIFQKKICLFDRMYFTNYVFFRLCFSQPVKYAKSL